MHVLSTPPAFVLSQDQTLQEKVRNSSIQNALPQSTSATASAIASANPGSCVSESQIYCRSNSPWHPDMDARSTSPPCTSAISSISCQTAASDKHNSEPRSAAASQRTSGLQASQLDPPAFLSRPPASSQGARRALTNTPASGSTPPGPPPPSLETRSPIARQRARPQHATSKLRRHDQPTHQVRPDGLEPSTSDLRGPCSTN